MKVVVTGGAGFIGSNVTSRLLSMGHEVHVIDNLSRTGTPSNLEWLKTLPGNLVFHSCDIRNYEAVCDIFNGAELVYHLAAQVAVTTSVVDPRHDFETNLLGTFNILEAIRKQQTPPMIIFTSTNKVYGKMDFMPICERNHRWEYADLANGNPESTPLDFYSPYGCSKGGADQYVHDYCRIYSIPSAVFRMSCIYGPRQMGCEDQGWVAFFLIQAALGNPITIFGDGMQIRDVLFIDDLVDAFIMAFENRAVTCGRIYNIGGGPEQTLSLLEFIDFIEHKLSRSLPYQIDDWRPGDQKVYVSDIRRAFQDFGWKPTILPEIGITRLFSWINQNINLFQ